MTVEGNRPGPTIALRADMDALPMTDASGTPYASQTPGCAHTCGHDGHTTWLAGALSALHAKNDFPGRVLGIFQPAEEIGTGAMAVVKAGALQKYGVREIYGMHAEPSVDAGKMGSRWAHAGRRRLLLRDHRREGRARGAPADGGRPHPLRGGIDRGAPDGRDAPHRSDAAGRDFGLQLRGWLHAEMAKTVKAVAEAHGCVGSLRIEDFGNPVINHPETTAFARAAADELYGEGTGVDFPLTMGGEDFSEYQAVVPGTMIRFGVRDAKHQASLHHPKFDFNDRVLGGAATFLAETVRKRLAMLAD